SLAPAILHTSPESRKEALKHYELTFGTNTPGCRTTVETPPHIYINFNVDRIFVIETFLKCQWQVLLGFKIQRIALKYLSRRFGTGSAVEWVTTPREIFYYDPFKYGNITSHSIVRCIDPPSATKEPT
ncbi:hypothetical protein BJ875DRAFT_390454, partial [Amylocarpus encephaloides]